MSSKNLDFDFTKECQINVKATQCSANELMILKNLQFVHFLRQTDDQASCTSKVRIFATGNFEEIYNAF